MAKKPTSDTSENPKRADNKTSPKSGIASFPIVGIGASAGGLASFESFFSGMPSDAEPGMAFVVIQHLAPDHKSILSELIRRYTTMQVFEAEDGMKVELNCIYIIPPNRDLAILGGTLQLIEPVSPRGQRLPIDYFFRSLAEDRKELAIGIVLCGNASDGTLGIRAIRSAGGMVMAQSPETCQFDGMPNNAIATGLVDYILPPSEMPEQLIDYVAHLSRRSVNVPETAITKDDNALQKIFILLRSQTGHDFSEYKPSTLYRRIERRMSVQHIETVSKYVQFLQKAPNEVEALFHDLLIGVTSFFRDPETYHYLKKEIVPKLFLNRPPESPIRIWVTACSTGEEAYSLAILLHEYMETTKISYPVQIFASDIDAKAIATARAGFYPLSISSDFSAERLSRFFTAELDGSGYRIHKNIRDMVIFSEHNVVKDPPFSKLDFISCRNLLIYMQVELQRKLIGVFHYALNPGGFLFLGSSETVGELGDFFTTLDQKFKVYVRKENPYAQGRTPFPQLSIHRKTTYPKLVPTDLPSTVPNKLPLRELTEQAILKQMAPAGALVDKQGNILYLHGRTGKYLEMPAGISGVNNILNMAREGLQHELETALKKAVETNEVIQRFGLHVKTNGDFSTVNMTVRSVNIGSMSAHEGPLYLVVLEEVLAPYVKELESIAKIAKPESDPDKHIAALKQDLRLKESFLKAANEKLEFSNQELKSYNEEIQSINEELQSTNEELETSKEELQSVNEELSTVNVELQNKVTELSRSNNDMNNLLAGTGIATLFVDHKLKILRFTPAATKIINLINSDIGRPLEHIVSNLLHYDRLTNDIESVLETLIPKEVEVQTKDGEWYLMRLQPYRTLENVIEGAVISFINITQMMKMREELQRSYEIAQRLAIVVHDSSDAITVQDLDGNILAWNPAAEKLYGWHESEALEMSVEERIPEDLRENALLMLQELGKSRPLKSFATRRLTKSGKSVEVYITATALLDASGKIYAVATTERLNRDEADNALQQ